MIYSGIEWMIYVLQLFFLNSEQLKTISVRVELGRQYSKKCQSLLKSFFSRYSNLFLLPKLFWPTVRKNCSSDWEKTFEIRGWKLRIFKIFEITWTIYSNSERSEQFLVTECFFKLFLEISQISKNRRIIIQIGKNYWDLEICRKS